MKGLLTASLVVTVAGTLLAQSAPQGTAAPTSSMKAIAVVQPTKDKSVHGTITFEQADKGVRVVAHLEGLTPGKHGFHVHEFGDCSAPDLTSAGGHFNPTRTAHGAPTDATRHAGDLGNVTADSTGVAHLEWLDPMMQLTGPNSVIGRSVIVHANEDDLKTQPTGNAGGREGCGVIGVAKS